MSRSATGWPRRTGIGILWLCLMLAGCNIASPFGPPPTSVVIYVTATALPATATDLPETVTALFGPTLMPTWTPPPTWTSLPPSPLPPTLTPTFTPEFTNTPTPKSSTLAAQAAQACGSLPANGFTTIFLRDSTLRTSLGCPQSGAIAITGAVEPFERGQMVWVSAIADQPTHTIYVLYADGTAQHFPDSWQQGVDPVDTGESAPAGRLAPVRGFGKIWHSVSSVRSGLGWALGAENGSSAEIERFTHGAMIFIGAANQTFIVIDGPSNGTWRADSTHF